MGDVTLGLFQQCNSAFKSIRLKQVVICRRSGFQDVSAHNVVSFLVYIALIYHYNIQFMVNTWLWSFLGLTANWCRTLIHRNLGLNYMKKPYSILKALFQLGKLPPIHRICPLGPPIEYASNGAVVEHVILRLHPKVHLEVNGVRVEHCASVLLLWNCWREASSALNNSQ